MGSDDLVDCPWCKGCCEESAGIMCSTCCGRGEVSKWLVDVDEASAVEIFVCRFCHQLSSAECRCPEASDGK
jgi:hypothetical protein